MDSFIKEIEMLLGADYPSKLDYNFWTENSFRAKYLPDKKFLSSILENLEVQQNLAMHEGIKMCYTHEIVIELNLH